METTASDGATKLTREAWIEEVAALLRGHGLADEFARTYAASMAEPGSYYDDDYSPADAVSEDGTYWD